ncbi:COG1042 Acyl-CoA synthetase (NDP forming) [Acidimicrobiia bacterium]
MSSGRVAGRFGKDHFDALFDPRGVVVAGASTHPGKFGFVALHNILSCGYTGNVFATNRDGAEVLGRPTLQSVADVPSGDVDLVFVCTPSSSNFEVLSQAAERGIRAAFIASAGYGESGTDGEARQQALVEHADSLGILLVGPNGQGLVSTPSSLCAQIVAPNPPRGNIGVASQSGNFVSSFLNLSRHSEVGISRAISVGNAAQVGVIDMLEYFADDPETLVGLVYVEGIPDGRAFFDRLCVVTRRLPVVILKGGASESGARAAASHTGSLASNDRVFDGMCRQAGAIRAANLFEAFDTAALLATQPQPSGPRLAVVTTVGGWGVVTADAVAETKLDLITLPGDLRESLDTLLPPRWSRNNPIDLAGGETKDTVADVLGAVVSHPEVDAVILLGVGIQSNQGRLEREGEFFPEFGLERITAFHDRQDARYADLAGELSVRHGKPVLVATELAVGDPSNAAVAAVRAGGRYCFPSADRAVRALDHVLRSAQWRSRRGLPLQGG